MGTYTNVSKRMEAPYRMLHLCIVTQKSQKSRIFLGRLRLKILRKSYELCHTENTENTENVRCAMSAALKYKV